MAKKIPAIHKPLRRKPGTRRYAGSAVESAAAMIGRVEAGDEITGITNGQFSLIDMIEHLLGQTGPADVVVSTWTMGIYDADRARAFCSRGDIRRIRWLVDPSMFGRRPELAGQLIETFGIDAFRAVNTHAKFATLRGDALAIAVRSSMNLNPNKRLENFDISADAEMVAWFEGFADSVFEDVSAHNTSQSKSVFANILAAYEKSRPDTSMVEAVGGMDAELEGVGVDLGDFEGL